MPDMTLKKTLVIIISNIDQTLFEFLNVSGSLSQTLPDNGL